MAQKKKNPFVNIMRQVLRKTKNAETEITDPQYKKMIDESPDTKAPFAAKTKGYYRFASEYPSTADADGYRVNGMREKKPLSTTALVFLIVGIVLCFCAGYVGTDTALAVSDLPPETTAETTVEITRTESVPSSEMIVSEEDLIG